MKRIYKFHLMLLTLFFISGLLPAQILLYEDNFESYITGSFLAEQNPDWWTTWSGNVGGGEDALISEDVALSPVKSVLIDETGGATDLLCLLGDKVSGVFNVNFWMYIPAGFGGYYNFQHFETPGVEWALEMFFHTDGTTKFLIGGQNITDYTFNHDSWMYCEHIINLNDDNAKIFIDGNLILEWQWSLQSQGGTGTNQLGAINFYAGSESSDNPKYYFDDVEYIQTGLGTDPIISVSPISLEQILEPNQSSTQNLTIGNIGVNDLEFEIAVVYNIDDEITPGLIPTANLSNNLKSGQVEGSKAPNYISNQNKPAPNDDIVLHYDGENHSAIGWAYSFDVEVAAMFPASITGPYAGMQIASVDVYIHDVGENFYLRIYGMSTNCEPGELLVEQAFTPQGESWENIVLDEPLNITGEDIWVGYVFTQFPLSLFVPGVDEGPNDPNGDWIKIGPAWTHLSANPDLPYNWNIRANLTGDPIVHWLTVDPPGGTVTSQETQEVDVIFNASGLTPGIYEANLVIISNDPEIPVFEVPVSLNVNMETHTINVNFGYQFVSTNVDPVDDDMLVVVEEILNDNLAFVRNSQGQTLRKIGPNWVNGIGDWIIDEGYLVKMYNEDSFVIEGFPVDPITPIPVETGFQFVSFFPETPMDALDAFATIIGDDLDFVRNSQGQTLRKIGPNWINGIGDCQPGEGYLVEMFADNILIYPGPAPFICGDPIIDTRDEQIYNTVQIGEQCWMAENMNIGEMINGSEDMTDNSVIEKYCYENNPLNCNEYGGLYQWNEMMQYVTDTTTQGICPEGWYLPSDFKFKILEGNVDSQYPVGDTIWNNSGWRGFDVGKILKSTTGWYQNTGTDAFGFTVIPGGKRSYNGSFNNYERNAHFWSSSEQDNGNAGSRYFLYSYDWAHRANYGKIYGYSVRCLKDNSINDNLSIKDSN